MTDYVDSRRKTAVVIPSYKVKGHIDSVISLMPDCVWRVYVVDDACPEQSGKYVEENISDPRVHVIFHEKNKGVGGAVMTGYQRAILDGADVMVKIDGDGQMDPALIPAFIAPILDGDADYTKGNRFFYLDAIHEMPKLRLFGNAMLSFLTKLSSGYWDLFDPTNGYTAIHANVARNLPLERISERYFFESDMLFRLNTLQAVVLDVPMDARYEDETSHLKVSKIVFEFAFKNAANFIKRIFYNYYLRDFSLASLELPLGLLMFFSGLLFGLSSWYQAASLNVETTAGTVMLSALPMLVGLQLVMAFLAHDISMVPRLAIHKRLLARKSRNGAFYQ